MKKTCFAHSALLLALSTSSVGAISLPDIEVPQPIGLWESTGELSLSETATSSQTEQTVECMQNWVEAYEAMFIQAEQVI